MNSSKATVFYLCHACGIAFEVQVEQPKSLTSTEWYALLERSTTMHECHVTSAMELIGHGTFRGFRLSP